VVRCGPGGRRGARQAGTPAGKLAWHVGRCRSRPPSPVTATRLRFPAARRSPGPSSFRTLTPASTDRTMIFEGYHQTYGVGCRCSSRFSHPVTNKKAVERALQIRTSKPVVRAPGTWDGNSALNFRPREYWPRRTTQVNFNRPPQRRRDGTPACTATTTLTQQFTIGDSPDRGCQHGPGTTMKPVQERPSCSGAGRSAPAKPGDNTPQRHLPHHREGPTRS